MVDQPRFIAIISGGRSPPLLLRDTRHLLIVRRWRDPVWKRERESRLSLEEREGDPSPNWCFVVTNGATQNCSGEPRQDRKIKKLWRNRGIRSLDLSSLPSPPVFSSPKAIPQLLIWGIGRKTFASVRSVSRAGRPPVSTITKTRFLHGEKRGGKGSSSAPSFKASDDDDSS